jgi:hypothetical protein
MADQEAKPTKKRTAADMAAREGRRLSGKRRPGFDRAMQTEDRPQDVTERRPGTYETK